MNDIYKISYLCIFHNDLYMCLYMRVSFNASTKGELNLLKPKGEKSFSFSHTSTFQVQHL